MVCDADTGEVLREGRTAHPDGTEVDPRLWWAAYEQASAGLLDGVAAIGVGGQQQGMIGLDEAGEVVRPALLWNDTRSARAAVGLTGEFGGPQAWADTVGLVPVASFTVTKLRWFARAEPDLAARTTMVLLPHDWLTHRLRADGGEPTTDRGDASGTGYWSPATGQYRPDLLKLAFGRDLAVPRVAGPAETVGQTAPAGRGRGARRCRNPAGTRTLRRRPPTSATAAHVKRTGAADRTRYRRMIIRRVDLEYAT